MPSPLLFAQTLAGNTPPVRTTAPSKPISPIITYCDNLSSGKTPIAHKIPHKIGKSKCEPVFSMSAGDKFTVNFFAGKDRFNAASALRILSADSLTALSAKPMILNSGFAKPADSCTWTSILVISIPLKIIEFKFIIQNILKLAQIVFKV